MPNESLIEVEDTRVNLKPPTSAILEEVSKSVAIEFSDANPVIAVYEDGVLRMQYTVDPLADNPILTGQFFHLTIRLLPSDAVMIEGLVTSGSARPAEAMGIEAIRFQPTNLSRSDEAFADNKGQGLFTRGLHFPGHITPKNVRLCCICDICKKSFMLQSIHTGYSESEYFYSEKGTSTLIVPRLRAARKVSIDELESLLPLSKRDGTRFGYFNPWRCPHCEAPYIDFKRFPNIRKSEYYANHLINTAVERFEVDTIQ